MRSPEASPPPRPTVRCAVLAAFLAVAGSPCLAQSQAEFTSCLARLQPAAQRSGVRPDSYSRHTDGVQADFGILDKLNYQPEFRLPIWDYLAALVDDERIVDGKAGLARHADVLQRIQAAYGVDPATVVAVWGVESNYGRITGKYPLVQALGTLSCFGRRQGYFQGEFYAALRILQRGDIAPDRLNGSWAGAFGHTQFMPATYERLAVDFDGDGRRDLVDNSDDALASTANFLRKGGWQSGLPWGFEVRLPAGFDPALAGRKNKRPASDWAARGIVAVDGRTLANSGLADGERTAILLPAGVRGPAFIVTPNFDVIYGYNAAESYGLAIAHLSDRLRGGPPFATPWPTDDPGLSRAERRELQTLLAARGHDIGAIDGMLGDKSRVAVRLEQSRLGQPVSGRGGQKLLQALRAEGDAQLPAGR
ncbi:MAG: lytic murein transglycosylase [Dechloromonas sp.]|nr:MAG: lytic murein transglycosylase [Dechloromonas sp.]